MMKLVIGTEAMFFLSLIMAFVYFSLDATFRQQEMAALDLRTTGLFSICLFLSSFTFWRAEKNFRKGRLPALRRWLAATLLLALIFLGGQGREYATLLHEKHISIGSNTFGTSFFTLTGFHGLHVIIGLLMIGTLVGLTFSSNNKPLSPSALRVVGMYWHFVDIVWLVVFLVVYLKPYAF